MGYQPRMRQKLLVITAALVGFVVLMYRFSSYERLILFVNLDDHVIVESRLRNNKTNALLCMVLTTEEHILTRGLAVWHTYGQQCGEILFACNCLKVMAVKTMVKNMRDVPVELKEYKKVVDLPVLHVNVEEKRNKMGEKVLVVLKESYLIFNSFVWYIMLDDDAYVFTDNLYKFINTKDSTEPLMYGFHFRHRPLPAGHIGGGPGILLTRESMKRLVSKINKNECNEYIDHYGDVTIGACGYAAGIHIGNSTDHFGRPRFHFYDPVTHFNGPVPEFLYLYGVHDKKIGKECCSLETISFHYVKVKKMYEIHSNKNFLIDFLTD